MTVLPGQRQRQQFRPDMRRGMEDNSTKPLKTRKGKGKGKENAEGEVPPSKISAGEPQSKKESIRGNDGSLWTWTTLADSSVSARPTVFTADGNYFFSIVGSSVRIYSAATGKVISTLSSMSVSSSSSRLAKGEGHTDAITATIINPENPFQLLTASLDGTIKIWDYLDAALLQTIHVGRPVSQMCAHEKFKGYVFVAVLTKPGKGQASASALDKGNTLVYRVSLKPKERSSSKTPKSSEIISVGKSRAAVAMAVSPSGSWLVVIAGHKAYVSMTSSLESGFTKFVSPERLTCLAFHPTEDYFATGDEQGQIRLWYCLNSQFKSSGGEKRAQTTTMHWHAHAVSSLAFTPNGAYLLSGGEESVLVIWQLQSGKREYVPRLGSPILQISVRRSNTTEEEYLAGLSDGTYIFINAASLSVSRSISRIKLDPRGTGRPSNTPVPFATHRKSATLILPAPHPSSLQIYSPATSTLLAELEVSPSNRVSRRDENPIEASRVDFAVVNPSGDWLATIDKRDNDEEFTEEVYLKIWHWDSSQWVLNTRIDRPHASKSVVSLAFSPMQGGRGELLMTAGLDGQIKTWCIRSVSTKEGKSEDFWIARSSFSFRESVPMDACWSPDGSLLAVCCDRQIALYDPYTNVLLDCLVTCDARHSTSVNFIGSSGRFLFVTGKHNAVLWDLISRTVSWQFHSALEIAWVISHPTEDIFAVIVQPFAEGDASRMSRVMLLRPQSPEPFETHSLPFRFRAASWYDLEKGNRTLLGITHTWNVVLCGDKPSVPVDVEGVAREISDSVFSPKRTLFQDIFGQSAFVDTTVTEGGARNLTTAARIEDRGGRATISVFDTPAYLAPPLETLYSSIMDDFLSMTTQQKEIPEEANIEEEEVPMVVDADVVTPLAQGRSVEASEIEKLVTLFKAQTITGTTKLVNRPNGVANGFSKIPETPRSATATPRLATPMHQNGIATVQSVIPSATHSPAPPSPLAVGKKRKKSAT